MRMIEVEVFYLSFCCGGPGGGFLSGGRQCRGSSWESAAVEDHAQTTQLCPGLTGSCALCPPEDRLHVCVWLVWQMYSFTCFSMRLNELHQEMVGTLPQTDCRLRPDIRAMENGDIGKSRWWYRHRTGCWVTPMFAVLIDLASQEKKRLEEKQRTARKSLSKAGEEWKTR